MAHVQGENIINRPVEDVFDFVADERNEPRYNRAMNRSELITEGPIGVGSRFHAVMSMRGRPADVTVEFTAYERPRFLASASHLSNMEIQGSLTFDPVPEGTRMRWSWELQPSGILKVLTPLIAYMGRRQDRAIWTGLKHILESQKMSAVQT